MKLHKAMKKIGKYFLWGFLITSLSECVSDDVAVINDIAGDWQIKQVTYRREQGGSSTDSIVSYSNSSIHFDKCKGGCEGWYYFDNFEKTPFYYYAHSSENNLMINVGSKSGTGINPSISLNGEAPFLERAKNRIIVNFDAGFKNSQGLTFPSTHKAEAILER